MTGSVIPSKQLHRAGTIEVLDTYLIDREIGYCTDDHCLYTKVDGVLVKCVEETPLTKAIKDNAYDSVTDPVRPDNITDIEQLTFVRNVGVDANYTMVESEERGYGVLIPPPSMEADRGKVPMYKTGNQIEWENVASGVTTTVSDITENTNVTLVAGQNRYLNCTNSPTISVEIADNNIYHLQINGSCTINLTGVFWSGDAITAITTKAEISILNNVAVGVLYE